MITALRGRLTSINNEQGTGIPLVNVERIPANGGKKELVIEGEEHLDFSEDGSRMTFLRFNQETFTRSLGLVT
jgi:hypothetical protein